MGWGWWGTELGACTALFRPGEATLLPVTDGPGAWTESEVPTCQGLSCLRWISKCLCGLVNYMPSELQKDEFVGDLCSLRSRGTSGPR